MDKSINVNLKVWRQRGPKEKGSFETYEMKNVSIDSSFFEMLDTLNEQLVSQHNEPIVLDHDFPDGSIFLSIASHEFS